MAAVCASAPALHHHRLIGTRRSGERRPPSRADPAHVRLWAGVSGHPRGPWEEGNPVTPKVAHLIPDLLHDDKRLRAPSSSPSSAPRVYGRATRQYGWTPAVAARSTAPRLRLSSGRPAAWQRTLSSNLAGAALLQRRRAWNRHASADATAALGGRWPARGTSSVSRHASASRDSSAV